MKIVAALCAALLLLSACQTDPYYKAMEMVGVEKRELLADRIDDTRQSMGEAQARFRQLITAYRTSADADPANIEGAYERFASAYDNASDKRRGVESDIDSVKRVADDMFTEWEAELDLYQDPALRAEAAARLEEMRSRYAALERSFDVAEQSLAPVLFAFRDRLLLLKRNQTEATLAEMKMQSPALTEQVRGAAAQLDAAELDAATFLSAMGG